MIRFGVAAGVDRWQGPRARYVTVTVTESNLFAGREDLLTRNPTNCTNQSTNLITAVRLTAPGAASSICARSTNKPRPERKSNVINTEGGCRKDERLISLTGDGPVRLKNPPAASLCRTVRRPPRSPGRDINRDRSLLIMPFKLFRDIL